MVVYVKEMDPRLLSVISAKVVLVTTNKNPNGHYTTDFSYKFNMCTIADFQFDRPLVYSFLLAKFKKFQGLWVNFYN